MVDSAAVGAQRWRIGVVGVGRVGAVLARGLLQAGHEVVAVAGESDASRARAARMLPGVPVAKPSVVARAADLVLLTVPDDSLENVVTVLCDAGAIGPQHVVLHTSGCHGLEILQPATRLGARAIALHPAMTFTGTEIDLPRLAQTVFGTTVEPHERDLAAQLVADLGGRLAWIPEERRGLYHAALAHGANHLVTLVSQALELLSAAGSADPSATLRPLLSAALDNALNLGDAALTGPIVRGDARTVSAHVDQLLANAPHSLPSYVALAHATLDRVVLDGRVLPIRAERIRRILDQALATSTAAVKSTATAEQRPNFPSGTAGDVRD